MSVQDGNMRLRMDLRKSIPTGVIALIKAIRRRNYQAYLVGGSVRDSLLKREIMDWDVATSAPPAVVMRLFSKAYPTGIRHGTVTVMYRGTRFEITTFRREGDYSDGRHPDNISFGIDISEDLSRRDFTINAIAYDPLGDKIIDPYGGISDIERRIIRTVGDPIDRFSEDGLRSMRAIRFATTLGFRIHRNIPPAIKRTLSVFRKVSPERIREELIKMLSSRRPSRGVTYMYRCGILEILLPELSITNGFKQNRWHRYDLFMHSLKMMDNLPPEDPELRLMGLLHDIAKPLCAAGRTEEATYYGHEVEGAEMITQIFRRLKFPNKSIERARLIVANHMIGYREDWSDAAIRRLIKRMRGEVYSLILFQRADIIARGTAVRSSLRTLDELDKRVRRIESESAVLELRQLKVNGGDVMRVKNIPPSPEVGRVLRRLMEMVIERPELNTRSRLLRLIEVV